jgi:hypothetical protein
MQCEEKRERMTGWLVGCVGGVTADNTSILSNGKSNGVLSVGKIKPGGNGTLNRTQPPGSTRVTPNTASSIYYWYCYCICM